MYFSDLLEVKQKKIIIITGRSGSGKSTAIAAFEDAGFYCVDNMPVALLPQFLDLDIESESEVSGFAFVMDLRESAFLEKYRPIFASLRKKGYSIEIIFLEASEETLLKRYSQTRRHHPLTKSKRLLEGIRAEKEQLKGLRNEADMIIDTSKLNVHEIKHMIKGICKKITELAPMGINVLSFGFKYGIPLEADLVTDVRFLSNPYFVPDLKYLDGNSKKIQNFVLNNQETSLFLRRYLDLLDYLLPLYEKEGKAYLTIAFGCTGGRHRSVVIAQSIFQHIKKKNKQVKLTHRDIGNPSSV